MTEEEEQEIYMPFKLLTSWKPSEEFETNWSQNCNKATASIKTKGYDLITGRIIKELPDIGIRAITQIFNSVLRTGYFPGQWMVFQTITILKPGKPAEAAKSYRPISLLQILWKLFEKIFVTRIKPTLQQKGLYLITSLVSDWNTLLLNKYTV